jgi:hypothetical protein
LEHQLGVSKADYLAWRLARDRPNILAQMIAGTRVMSSQLIKAWVMTTNKRYRCRYCGAELPAWLPVAKRPNGAMLLYHLGQQHPDQVGHYLDQIRHDEDIAEVAAQAYEVVEEEL